jgi:hypothetical protein
VLVKVPYLGKTVSSRASRDRSALERAAEL